MSRFQPARQIATGLEPLPRHRHDPRRAEVPEPDDL
jgi:hypothetical protein